jgi:hypothetical protein
MPLTSPSEPTLPAAWTQVLEQIQQVLAETSRAVEERAHALDAPDSEEHGKPRDLDAVLYAVASAAESKPMREETLAEAEQSLARAQAALDCWLATAGQLGQRLAEQATRAV